MIRDKERLRSSVLKLSLTKIGARLCLAREIGADLYVMATDVDGVYLDWGTPEARKYRSKKPRPMNWKTYDFAAGSMGPKVAAACAFARSTGNRAAIGALADIEAIVAGEAGTNVEKG